MRIYVKPQDQVFSSPYPDVEIQGPWRLNAACLDELDMNVQTHAIDGKQNTD
jgi:hypothetical protein